MGIPATAATTRRAAPGVVLGNRPVLSHGAQSGDVTSDGALVWTRADRPSRMVLEVSDNPDFRGARVVGGPLLTPDTGGTGKLRLTGLPPGHRIHYRVRAEDLDG